MRALDAAIRALEDRFGLTPAARLRLGIALGDAARSLEDLNASLLDDDGQEPADDPRFDDSQVPMVDAELVER